MLTLSKKYKASWPYFRIGCDPLETNNQLLLDCLQQVNVNLIYLASTGLLTYPAFVLDKNVISDEPRKLFEDGKFKRCNILTGFNNYAEISLAPTEISNELINELLYGKMSSLKIALKIGKGKKMKFNKFF